MRKYSSRERRLVELTDTRQFFDTGKTTDDKVTYDTPANQADFIFNLQGLQALIIIRTLCIITQSVCMRIVQCHFWFSLYSVTQTRRQVIIFVVIDSVVDFSPIIVLYCVLSLLPPFFVFPRYILLSFLAISLFCCV